MTANWGCRRLREKEGDGSIQAQAAAHIPDHTLQLVFLSIAAAGIFAGQPVFWSLPSRFPQGAGAAAGLAAINSVGNLGSFIAQSVVHWIKDVTGSTIAPMFFLAARLVIAVLLVLLIGAWCRARRVRKNLGNSGAARVK